ncbi:MAG: ribonuclease D [Gemmatimonadota bacterium]|nr:MAG: ribonuclease D [Gemmatimonadota bacterium]
MGKKPPNSSPQLIADAEALTRLVDRLAHQRRVALDTEAASFHRYVDRVYLIQLASDSETALIDPLAVDDLRALGQILKEPSIEIVLHDADYDLRILNRDYGFTARSLFDTRVAAQLAGEPAVGLGALLEKHFGVTVNKKLQRADWSRRPLTPEMIEYAAADASYLPPLRDHLERRLEEEGRLKWAHEEFRLLEQIRWKQPAENGEAYLRVKGSKALPRRSLAVLREVFEWRESAAKALDRAPFRVLGNAALLAIAKATPRSQRRLKVLPGVPASAVARYGADLVEAVTRGLAVPQADLPVVKRPARPEHDHAYDKRLEVLKNLRNRTARDVQMESGMLCPNGTLQALARAAPTTEKQLSRVKELREWQADVLGRNQIIAAMRGEPLEA